MLVFDQIKNFKKDFFAMDFNVCLYRYPYIKYEKNKHAKTENSAFSEYSFVRIMFEKKCYYEATNGEK